MSSESAPSDDKSPRAAAPETHGANAASPQSDGGHGSAKVVIWALVINLVIAAVKFAVAAVSGSTAMLAEALHSLADTGNQIFLLLGMKLGARPADDDHPFGYAAERYFWAFMAALGIFSIGGALSVYEGGKKLFSHEHEALENPTWAFVVLGASIVLESISFWVAIGEFRRDSAGKGLRRTVRETRDPTVITVLFEDAAALTGLVFAFTGIGLAKVTGDMRWDGAASVLVGCVLIVVAVFLARSAKGLLIGQSVPAPERQRIVEIARGARDVLEVIHIRTLHIGPDEVMCGLKLRFTPTLQLPELEARINELEASLRAALPHLRRIYVEPGFDERAKPPAAK